MLESLHRRLIVSCQASEDDAFFGSENMARFARAARDGGAAGIRANSPADVAAVSAACGLPVIGIQKRVMDDGRILITPDFDSARDLVAAGASAIAVDCTLRGQRYGALERLRRIKDELHVPVLADIATEQEADAAAEVGADFVLSTMRGYTAETAGIRHFEPEFIAKLARRVRVPVIAEGMIGSAGEAQAAMDAGAWAVIVGTAITRPHSVTAQYARAIDAAVRAAASYYIGIDLGATRTKYGVADGCGRLLWSTSAATPAQAGRDALLDHLRAAGREAAVRADSMGVAISAMGIAAAGWVDAAMGEIVFAGESMPGWTGARLDGELAPVTGVPVCAENDARAAALGEMRFGAARYARDFILLTLGTGVGGGVVSGGKLLTGSSSLGGALGHQVVVADGFPCSCGRLGCLEVYANQDALLRYARPAEFGSARDLIVAANGGDAGARAAIRLLAARLAQGCANLVHAFDPELIVLAGGLVENNPLLIRQLEKELPGRVFAWDRRKLRVVPSALGYQAGIFGAVAVASEAVRKDLL